MTQQRERTVASGFPSPDGVPGPTERLRELHGEAGSEPAEPRYGRASVADAATEDVVPVEQMASAAKRAERENAIAGLGRRAAAEAVARTQAELERRRVPERLQRAGAGTGQLAAAGALGVCAAGALTAGVVMLWQQVLPPWAAAFVTTGTFGAIAAPLTVAGLKHVKQGMAGLEPG